MKKQFTYIDLVIGDREELIERSFARLKASTAGLYPVSQSLRDSMISAYDEPHRYYHNINHILWILTLYDKAAKMYGHGSLEWAIWFHDIIYDPLHNDNEEASAAYFRLLAPTREWDIGLVISHILASKNHIFVPNLSGFFLDLDLSILAATPERYDQYVSDVRKEYQHVSDADWRIGRRRVLEKFLERAKIFHSTGIEAATGIKRIVLDRVARVNMQREIDSL